MVRSRNGDKSAFDSLVRRHERRVFAVAGRLLGRRHHLVLDVAQEAFLNVYRALGRYQPCGKFQAYLYRVLINECRMVLRSAQGEESALESIRQTRTVSTAPAEATLLARERQRKVEVALGHLSPKLQEVIVLRYSGGLAYDEISEALAVPLGTVKRRLFDAMERLRQILEEA